MYNYKHCYLSIILRHQLKPAVSIGSPSSITLIYKRWLSQYVLNTLHPSLSRPTETISKEPLLTYRARPGCRPDLFHRVNHRKSKPVCEIGCQGGPWRSSSMYSLSLTLSINSLIYPVFTPVSAMPLLPSSAATYIPLFYNNFISYAETLVRLCLRSRDTLGKETLLGTLVVPCPEYTSTGTSLGNEECDLVARTRELRRDCRWPVPILRHLHSLWLLARHLQIIAPMSAIRSTWAEPS